MQKWNGIMGKNNAEMTEIKNRQFCPSILKSHPLTIGLLRPPQALSSLFHKCPPHCTYKIMFLSTFWSFLSFCLWSKKSLLPTLFSSVWATGKALLGLLGCFPVWWNQEFLSRCGHFINAITTKLLSDKLNSYHLILLPSSVQWQGTTFACKLMFKDNKGGFFTHPLEMWYYLHNILITFGSLFA